MMFLHSLKSFSLLLVLCFFAEGSAWAQPADAENAQQKEPAADSVNQFKDETPKKIDQNIEHFRTPVDRLLEQTLGSTSRPVGFAWRKSWLQVGLLGSELLERNNFGSFRGGISLRKAFGDVLVEGALNYVKVIGTPSSRVLALTPYVQSGRPSRFEIDVNVSYPLVEGVVTPLFNFLPPMEMVFLATLGGRYLLYPEVVVGKRDWRKTETWTDVSTWRDVGLSLASPQLSDADLLALDNSILGGMTADPARMHSLIGFTFDTYMQPGLFVSTRILVAVPILASATNTKLGFWPEISVALGYAF